MTEVESSMNFFDHIKELRQKLLYVIIFFLITFIVSFYFSQSIFEFLAKPLTSILGEGNGLIYTALQEAFLTNVKVSFFTKRRHGVDGRENFNLRTSGKKTIYFSSHPFRKRIKFDFIKALKKEVKFCTRV